MVRWIQHSGNQTNITTSLDGTMELEGYRLQAIEAAFLAYLLIRRGEAKRVVPFLKAGSEQGVPDKDTSLLQTSCWLWVFGEYVRETEDHELLQKLEEPVQQAIHKVLAHWSTPETHWLGIMEPAIYTSNIAIHYGALLSVQNLVMHEEIQRGLKEIRECIFSKWIKKGKIVSRLGSEEIYGDIILTAIPFGLLGIEDRILIEALMEVESKLIDKGVRLSLSDTYFGGCELTALSGLLAWYYTEKGELGKAKRLLTQLERLRDQMSDNQSPLLDIHPDTSREALYKEAWLNRSQGQYHPGLLAVILHDLAVDALKERTESEGASNAAHVQIIHLPSGKDDPYVILPCERYPRHPKEGEAVSIHVQTEPMNPSQRVKLHWRVNDSAFTSAEMKYESSSDGEPCWEASLGRFRWGDNVEYYVTVESEEGITQSQNYSFEVLKWISLQQIQAVRNEGEKVVIQFATPLATPSSAVLTIGDIEEDCLSFHADMRFVTEDERKGAILHDETLEITMGAYVLQIEQSPEGCNFVIYDQGKAVVTSYGQHGHSFLSVLADRKGRMRKLRFQWRLREDELLFGMGERFSTIEYRGLDVDHYVYNEYRNQQLRTYIPVPFVLSTANYGMFLATEMYSLFRCGSRLSDLLEIEVDLDSESPQAELLLMPGKPLEVLKKLSSVTGKPTLPPKWSFGPWMSSNNWDSQHEVEKQVALTNQYQIPSTVIVLEQWSDEATFYIFNDAQYAVKSGLEALNYDDFTFPEWGRWPNPKQMVKQLHENGLKVLLWQIPIQKYMYGIPHAQRDADEQAMLENGFYVAKEDGEPYRIPYNWFKDCLVIDFSNPKAANWWFNKRLYLLKELGIDGFKTDGGECIFGEDVRFADGTTGARMRNRYPLDYIGSYYRFVQQHTDGQGITFSRAGYSGAQRYPLHWAGDERSTFAAFRSSIRAGLSCSMSGIPFWGWDLGGFHGDIPSAELFIRSAQMAAFCPVMQYHAETKGEFNQDRTPWNIAERTGRPEVIHYYKKYADLRMNLLPYIYDQALKCSRIGLPMMRAMFVEFPDERSSITLDDQYMFGDSLLVAPITEEGATVRSVYFPAGNWISLFGQKQVQGSNWCEVQADLDEIPVFIRQDKMIALHLDSSLQLASHVGNKVDRYENLCFYIYMQNQLDTVFEDDLGNLVHVSGTVDQKELNLRFELRTELQVTFIFKGLESVSKIEVNDELMVQTASVEQLDNGCYCSQDGDWMVRLDHTAQSLRICLE